MNWQLDASHTKVGFAVRHMMVSKVRGEFKEFEADIDIDPNDLAGSKVTAKIHVDSIDTNNDDRDGHLRSADFFNVEEYPYIEFESTEFRSDGDGNVEIDGDLTIRGETHPITLTGEQLGPAKSPFADAKSVGYNLSTTIERENFGLNWNKALETGGFLVGKKVEIEIDAEAVSEG